MYILPNAAIDWYFSVLSFIWGACLGSFANVCIYRIPQNQSVLRPRSFCPHCKQKIAWYDNIPLLSFFLLQMKCRRCRQPISGRYWLIELIMAICFLLIWRYYGWDWRTPVYWLMTIGLIIGSFIDFDHMIIPDRITIGGMLAGLALSLVFPAVQGQENAYASFRVSLIGLTVGGLVLWTVATLGTLAFRKEAMGMGDVKLLAALGAFLGWRAIFFIVMIASLFGAIVGISAVLAQRKSFGSRIPFGPYLALAALLWILGGQKMWALYLSWLTLPPSM